jgi:hypothetical protein
MFLLAQSSDLNSSLEAFKTNVIRTPEALHQACEHHRRGAVWVAPRAALLRWFSECSFLAGSDQRLLLLDQPHRQQHAILHALFRTVVARNEGLRLLPNDELLEVITAPNRDELLIGGAVDEEARIVVLRRGNLLPVFVPLDWFTQAEHGPRPDPSRFAVADFGHTVRLGEFEAATHAILYDFDKEFRQRAKKRLLEKDPSFGGAVRRLRILRGLTQADFPGVSAKEIARIESGAIRKPHGETMRILARRLRVKPTEMETY